MQKRDSGKERYWQRTIVEAVRSGMSIRKFCRQRRIKEGQFYWWQRKLKVGQQEGMIPRQGAAKGPASFALVSEEPGAINSGIELVLGGGRRLRISKGGMKRPYEPSWQRWSRRDAEFYGGDQGVFMHGSMRHEAVVRRPVDDGGTSDRVQSALGTPAGVL